jgi:hypothetical protein
MATARPYRNKTLIVAILLITAVATAGCVHRRQSSESASSPDPLAISSVGSTLAAPTESTESAPAASASSAPANESSPSGSRSTTAATHGSSCAAAGLRLTLTGVSGAGGRSYSTYELTNTGSSSCTLAQPTVSFLNAAGATVQAAALTGTAATLTLKPNESGALVVSDESCTQPAVATQLVAAIAGSAAVLALSGQYKVCAPTVTPLAAG